MVDRVSPEKRSEIMSNIRSKWTAPEKKMHGLMKSRKIRHKMHPKIAGSPDIVLKDSKTAVFIHGCFWHKCPKCYREPKSKREYWVPKIDRNVKRDRKNASTLRKAGWKVVRVWEHDIMRDALKCVERILK
jgi:DNA mismatch endonuclease (patch repair protein)